MNRILYFTFFIFIAINDIFGQQHNIEEDTTTSGLMQKRMLYFFKNDMIDQGFIVLDSVIALDSTNLSLQDLKGGWAWGLKRYDKGLESTIMQTKLAPQIPLFHLRTAFYYERLNDSINAKKYFLNTINSSNAILDTLKLNSQFEKSYASDLKFYRTLAKTFTVSEEGSYKLLNDLFLNDGKDPNSMVYRFLNKSRKERVKVWFKEK